MRGAAIGGRHAVAALLVAVLAGCGGDDAGNDGTTSVPTQTTTSTPVSPTSGTSASTSTMPAPTTIVVSSTSSSPTSSSPAVSTAAPTTRPPCPVQGGTESVVVDFPNRLSSLIGHDIRTGAHECFERVVVDFESDGEMPGFKLEYVDEPVHLSPSDLTVEIAGDATLVLSVGAWMTTMEGDGYQGPQQVLPANVAHIVELRLIENFEGMHAWAIGLDERRNFEVSTLTDPARIVVDVFGPAPA